MGFLLFVQHGWADNHYGMVRCAKLLGVEDAIAPNLGWWRTWWRIEPLIEQVRQTAAATIISHPHLPWRIVGHSMGGLIWLELLHRFPEWHDRVESLVLMGSPVGGAELGLILDPLKVGAGIARDLGLNRRPIGEAVAAKIPTLSIAGDIDGGSDGTITIGSTQFNYCQWQSFSGVFHANLRFDPRVIKAIQEFWQSPVITIPDRGLTQQLLDYLRAIPGIIDGHFRDFWRARVRYQFSTGLTLKQWHNPIGIWHIYLANEQNQCLYAGYVGWPDRGSLAGALAEIPERFNTCLSNPPSP